MKRHFKGSAPVDLGDVFPLFVAEDKVVGIGGVNHLAFPHRDRLEIFADEMLTPDIMR
jgi:hypothetical protein